MLTYYLRAYPGHFVTGYIVCCTLCGTSLITIITKGPHNALLNEKGSLLLFKEIERRSILLMVLIEDILSVFFLVFCVYMVTLHFQI